MPGQRQCNPKHKKKQDDWQERLPFCKTLETTKMKTLQKTDKICLSQKIVPIFAVHNNSC